MSYRSILFVALAVTATYQAPAAAQQAQAEGVTDCFKKNYDCGSLADHHWMVQGSGATLTGGHTNCLPNPGGHGQCEVGDALTVAAYREILNAADAGDVQKILRVAATKATDWVHVNRQRGTVQVYSCQKEGVVANLKLGSSASVAALAANLDRIKSDRALLASNAVALADRASGM
jgi:hypothetical protein